jgi:hypothetical protein
VLLYERQLQSRRVGLAEVERMHGVNLELQGRMEAAERAVAPLTARVADLESQLRLVTSLGEEARQAAEHREVGYQAGEQAARAQVASLQEEVVRLQAALDAALGRAADAEAALAQAQAQGQGQGQAQGQGQGQGQGQAAPVHTPSLILEATPDGGSCSPLADLSRGTEGKQEEGEGEGEGEPAEDVFDLPAPPSPLEDGDGSWVTGDGPGWQGLHEPSQVGWPSPSGPTANPGAERGDPWAVHNTSTDSASDSFVWADAALPGAASQSVHEFVPLDPYNPSPVTAPSPGFGVGSGAHAASGVRGPAPGPGRPPPPQVPRRPPPPSGKPRPPPPRGPRPQVPPPPPSTPQPPPRALGASRPVVPPPPPYLPPGAGQVSGPNPGPRAPSASERGLLASPPYKARPPPPRPAVPRPSPSLPPICG